MNDFGSDAFESVLFVARECFVYRIPARKSTAGYKAAEWGDMEAFLWKGRLRIIEKGEECFIRLEDKDSGESKGLQRSPPPSPPPFFSFPFWQSY